MKDAALVFILVLLILAVGLAVALSLEPETETRDKGALECVTGEAALNPTRVSDRRPGAHPPNGRALYDDR